MSPYQGYHNWDHNLRGSHLWGGPNSDIESVETENYSKRIPGSKKLIGN